MMMIISIETKRNIYLIQQYFENNNIDHETNSNTSASAGKIKIMNGSRAMSEDAGLLQKQQKY